jgi:hypothetical protein
VCPGAGFGITPYIASAEDSAKYTDRTPPRAPVFSGDAAAPCVDHRAVFYPAQEDRDLDHVLESGVRLLVNGLDVLVHPLGLGDNIVPADQDARSVERQHPRDPDPAVGLASGSGIRQPDQWSQDPFAQR